MLASVYRLWVFLNVAGVLGFVAAHGASSVVALRVRREREPGRIRAMLDLSRSTLRLMYWSLVLLLLGGIAAGFDGHWWGWGWIWAALGLLLALTAFLGAAAGPHYGRIRRAIRAAGPEPAPSLEALLRSPRPLVLAVVGTGGILAILALMIFKPF